MFRFATSSTMSAAAGEAILFDVQLSDFDGNAQSLAGRQIAFLVYDSTTEYQDVVGTNKTDTSGDYARFVLDGSVSESLRGKTGLLFEIAEQLGNSSRDQIMTGTLTINSSAPTVAANSGAPVARYITRVERLFDPTLHSVTPTFQFSYLTYGASTAVTALNVSTDFSSTDHTLMLTMV